MTDPTYLELWDFEDPSGSEQRLRAAADIAEGTDRLVLLTQVARALGLQDRYDEGHALLDDLATGTDEVSARISLERGRLLRSAGDPDGARPHFEAAEQIASSARLDYLHVDAVHMRALVADPADRLAITQHALELAMHSRDRATRDWDASLLTDIGMVHAEQGDFGEALAWFENSLTARERIGDQHRIRVSRWLVAWALRNLGRTGDALTMQRELKAELDAAQRTDPHVDEELDLLLR